jgi:hypothetical protein
MKKLKFSQFTLNWKSTILSALLKTSVLQANRYLLFFTQEWTPHFLRFDLLYTVVIPAAPQETVEEAGIEPGTAALQSGSPSRALAN